MCDDKAMTQGPEYVPQGLSKETLLSLDSVNVKVKTKTTPSFLKQIRELVESSFTEIKTHSPDTLSQEQLLLILSYNLAEDLINEKEKLKALKSEVISRSDRLLSRVESIQDNLK